MVVLLGVPIGKLATTRRRRRVVLGDVTQCPNGPSLERRNYVTYPTPGLCSRSRPEKAAARSD